MPPLSNKNNGGMLRVLPPHPLGVCKYALGASAAARLAYLVLFVRGQAKNAAGCCVAPRSAFPRMRIRLTPRLFYNASLRCALPPLLFSSEGRQKRGGILLGSLREGAPRSGEGARVGWKRGCRNRVFCKGKQIPYWYKTSLYLRRLPPSLRCAPCHLCPSALMVAARRSQALSFRSLAALLAIPKQLSIVLKRLTPGGRHSCSRRFQTAKRTKFRL